MYALQHQSINFHWPFTNFINGKLSSDLLNVILFVSLFQERHDPRELDFAWLHLIRDRNSNYEFYIETPVLIIYWNVNRHLPSRSILLVNHCDLINEKPTF